MFRIRTEVHSSEYPWHEFSEAFLCLKGRMTSDTYKCTRLKITILWLQDTKNNQKRLFCSRVFYLRAYNHRHDQNKKKERFTRDSLLTWHFCCEPRLMYDFSKTVLTEPCIRSGSRFRFVQNSLERWCDKGLCFILPFTAKHEQQAKRSSEMLLYVAFVCYKCKAFLAWFYCVCFFFFTWFR